MKERLQKLLAQANIASRRASEELITKGRVRVNGAVAQLGEKADPDIDVIEVDGVRLKFDSQTRIYIALNKPKHVLTTDKPHRTDKRETVAGLIGRKEHLFSIGRLDVDSEGLVVMTNDGDMAQRLSHPRYRHTKTYQVDVLGLPTAETIDKWQEGVFLEEGKTAPCFVEITHGSVKGSTLRIVMTEGKKRQIRRVAALLGHPVRRLLRTQIGMMSLGTLEPGKWRELTPKEVLALGSPAPEIKMLRSQKRRTSPVEDAAPTPEKTASPDESQKRRRTPPINQSVSGDAPQRKRRTPPDSISDSSDTPPKKRRTPPTSAPDSSDEMQKKRRPSRARKSDAHDDRWGKPAQRNRKPGSRKDRPR